MPVSIQDRPLNQLREEVVDLLVLNYGHNKISKEAFERRLDQAYDAEDHDALSLLAADLHHYGDSPIKGRRNHILYAPDEAMEDSDWIVNIFSGTERNQEEIVPANIKIANIFGGSEIDYSLALFSAPVTEVKVFLVFGGAEIHVPEGVRVKTRMIPLFGGLSNKSEPGNDPHAPTVVISGLALFGGLTIGVKRSLRERILAFADSVKQKLS